MSLYNIFNNILGSAIGSTSSGAVSSVAGKTGAVSLVSSDVTDFQPAVSLNTDVVSTKNKTQFFDTSGQISGTIIPSVNLSYSLGNQTNNLLSTYTRELISERIQAVDYIFFKTNNVRLGHTSAGPSNTNSLGNVCIGNGAGDAITGGGTNVCIGDISGFNLTNGNNNICIGQLSSSGMYSGNSNIFIGENTQSFNTTTNNCTIIGSQSKAGGNDCIAIGYNVAPVPSNNCCIGNQTIISIYNEADGKCDLGKINNKFKDIYLAGSVNCSGLKFNNLVGPGTLRIDANGNVFVDIPLITPTNLTSNTSDSNFIVSRSSIKDNDPINEAYYMFDSQAFHPVWLCGNNQYDWIGGHANGNDNFQGITGSWFKITLNTAKSWNQYTIKPSFREELLSSWRIYGSNDDINYTLITSQTDYTFPNFTNANLLTETFTMGYEVSYRYIVFHVTKIRNEGSLRMYFGIREFRFNKV